jgi:glycosyltransferase involved in cell wall biosynthesis
MIKDKTILFFADWFEPGYKAGGPIRSVTNMVKKIGAYHNVYVVTSDTDFNEEESYADIESNKWIEKDWGKIIYLDKESLNAERYTDIFKEVAPDFIHLNSFFSPKFSLLPLKLAKHYEVQAILAPRGMLGGGSLAIKKLKKKLFLFLVKLKGIYKDVIWHASTELEAQEIRDVFGEKSRIKVALNLVHLDVKSKERVLKERSNELFKFVYIARVSKIKNLYFALDRLSEMKFSKKIVFDIYGPIEEQDYWDSCKEKINEIDHVTITYKGELPHNEVSDTFMKYNCLFLPTQNENFGHVFLEAWSSGCQTLISDNTPWQDLIDKGVGASISLDDEKGFVDAIESLLFKFENGESEESIETCLKFAQDIIDNKEHLNANLNLFKND